MNFYLQYLAYLFRWQLSSLILAPVLYYTQSSFGLWGAVVVANLVGGIIFFWVDGRIFSTRRDYTELRELVERQHLERMAKIKEMKASVGDFDG